MNPGPSYKKIVTYNVVMLAVVAGLFVLFVRPLQGRIDVVEEENAALSAKLKSKRYPQKPTDMLHFREQRSRQQAIVEENYSIAFHRSRDEFPKLRDRSEYDTFDDFRLANQLAYQILYLDIVRELGEQGIVLHEETLGRTQYSTTENDKLYQLIPSMWVVKNVAILARKHNLSLTNPKLGEATETEYADISVLPLRTYNTAVNLEPYLEEYPVRVTVRGTTEDFTDFMLALTGEGHFLPVEFVRLVKVGAKIPNRDRIEATIVCSGFLPLVESKTERITSPADRKSKFKYMPGA
jgi:hypothetical protein